MSPEQCLMAGRVMNIKILAEINQFGLVGVIRFDSYFGSLIVKLLLSLIVLGKVGRPCHYMA